MIKSMLGLTFNALSFKLKLSDRAVGGKGEFGCERKYGGCSGGDTKTSPLPILRSQRKLTKGSNFFQLQIGSHSFMTSFGAMGK